VSLTKRDGFWHVDIRAGGRRIRKSTGVPLSGTKLSALEIHDKIERDALERAAGAAAGDALGPTLGATFDAALHDREQWRSGDQRTLESTFKALTAQWPADTPLGTIGDDEVQQWRRRMFADGLAPNTVNARLSMLSVLFKQAKLRAPQYDRAKVRKGRIRVLSREEELQVHSWFIDQYLGEMADLVSCLIDTGFRLSEMLRVTPRDIDWAQGTLACWENKADHPRVIPMTARVMRVFKYRPRWKLTVDRAEHHWARMRAGLGLAGDREFVLHALRHTCASRLAAAGVDAFRIQAWMGHKSVTTTQQYVTIFGHQLLDLARVLEGDHRRDHKALNDLSQPEKLLVQQVVTRTVNPQVPGSSPGRGAKEDQALTGTFQGLQDSHVTGNVTAK